ncbi:L-aspartate--glyoxylate aminotransferase BhcA [Sinorhizobium meliloti]|jgi:alanine-glyoxylate transaminase / serine-glyoxylate transaminase / serine-pyruvate transaminase|uniref:L-aspartate--glyoxylate aminotransferase BhcA n=1 Tax=Rhizobium meliloti TaxID=382 RepID=UPI000FD49AF9|nr:L-aspartate--glyoxylate aminotransferase BhcA [Sinorhizobium meliloti]MQV33081.1 aminotransferase class V-fold PLP-dependent enzyme [Sinorhizobium meliloti]RVE79396.1 aminotransferase class V-fold PLP-dependent enzyme [Sinorhizobium meliloti]RVG43825.1 aminotransferase class V-fold PLP-dependent enzyme [Sinorhizobium meliloti]RVM04387.1 aminotransferase class V-fold PLP-dependent enzyme [Sinorhizobium meliloti]RVM43400.1 aminotransferase class V-fold PLP-dependent enzyme [Sinorhizobium meli
MYLQNPVFIPGPTNMPEVLRKASDMPTIDHRSSLFGEILRPALAGVKKVVKSQSASIFVFPATGTGGWETAITNTLSPGDRVLVARYGMFSHRWIDMCQRHGLDVSVIETPWGSGAPVDRYEEMLTADKAHQIKAVLVTHNETATGVKSDIAAVRRALDAARHPAMLFVDGVSSIASMEFRMDDWGVDVAVTGSQKGFMLPAGLAITAFSPKALAALETAKLPRTFFDVRDMSKSYENNAYPYTPAVGLLNGLKVSTEMLLAEGLENVFARHKRIATGIRAAVRAWGLELCAMSEDLYSDTVSAIRTPDGFDATSVVTHAAKKYDVAFGVGLGEVAGKVFRIGHLGSLTDVMALSGIATAEMVMADLGLSLKLGSGVAAAQDYYRNNQVSAGRGAA